MKTLYSALSMCLLLTQLSKGQDSQQLPIESTIEHSQTLDDIPLNDIPFGKSEVLIQPPAENFVRAFLIDGTNLDLRFNADATRLNILLPEDADESQGIRLVSAEGSVSLADGTIILSALDAKVSGDTAKLETHPGNHRIGFWSNEEDTVGWNFQPSRWGKYEIDLVYSQAGKAGTVVEVSFLADKAEGKAYKVELGSTGSWYRYTTINVGTHYFDDQTYKRLHQVKVGCKNKVGGAVMNLKAIVLRPTSEGEQPVVTNDDGNLIFPSQDATVIGTRLVYEPNPKKLTLGWWAKVEDKARWGFSASEAGHFDVQILQGCGKGQGGSTVAVDILPAGALTTEPHVNEPIASVKFEVEDTGHFQNFKERNIGSLELEPGDYILQVRPIEKAKNAVMDLRELKLLRKK